jgi:hypothetical protein
MFLSVLMVISISFISIMENKNTYVQLLSADDDFSQLSFQSVRI